MALSRSQDYTAFTTIVSAEVDAEFDELYAAIGTQTYTEQNYVTNDDTSTEAIDELDQIAYDFEEILEAITNGTVGTTANGDFKVDVLADDADCGTHPVITTGVNDGTQDIDFPTNNMSAAKFMLGTSSTIIWMYLNTAPPGWKALSTGADTVCGISGGAGDYNVNGGNPDSSATWTIAGLTKDAHTHDFDDGGHTHTGPSHAHGLNSHTHTGPNHNHQWFDWQGAGTTDKSYASNGTAQNLSLTASQSGNYHLVVSQNNYTDALDADQYTSKSGTGNTGAAAGNTENAGTGASGSTNATGTTGAQSDSAVSSDGTWRASASVGKLFQLDTS